MTETAADPRRVREDRVIYRARKILQRRWEERELKPTFTSECQAMEFFRCLLAGHENERIVCASLDVRHRLLAVDTVGIGGLSDCAIYPREFVRAAVEQGAYAVMIAHNHPSGDPTPSFADASATESIGDALALLDIKLLDHIVVATGGSKSDGLGMKCSGRLNQLIIDCLQSRQWFVCDQGFIWKRNWNHTSQTRRCRLRVNAQGYARVALKRPGERSHEVMAHRVVAFAMLGPPPSLRHEVNHINGVKRDNRPCNIEWVERPENLIHAWQSGLRVPGGPIGQAGENHHKAKLTEDDVREIHRLKGLVSQYDLAARFGVNQSTVSLIHSGKNWPAIHREFNP